MGYTHYWYRPIEIDRATFSAILRDFEKIAPIMLRHGIPLAGPYGEGDPVLSDEEICFNGRSSCGHPVNTKIRNPWPAADAAGVAAITDSPLAGRWYAGATLSTRCCSGNCRYETFDFPRIKVPHRYTPPRPDGLLSDFCKTGFRPYDIAVTAMLVIAAHHLGPKIEIGSDGQQEHWFDAQLLCQMELGYGLEFQLPRESTDDDGPDGVHEAA